jgi:hypothetical protein
MRLALFGPRTDPNPWMEIFAYPDLALAAEHQSPLWRDLEFKTARFRRELVFPTRAGNAPTLIIDGDRHKTARV